MDGRTPRRMGALVRFRRGWLRPACIFAMAFLLAACGGASNPQERVPLKGAMVTDVGGLGDKSFNDSAYQGLMLSKEYLGASTQVLQSRSAADYQPNLSALAGEG